MIIFSKFHEDWAKTVNFLQIANYLASPHLITHTLEFFLDQIMLERATLKLL